MSGAMELPRLQLRRNEDRRIRQGHNWVYSNEIDTAATPLRAFTPGAQALLFAASGRPLGVVSVNPHSLICARMLVRQGNTAVGEAFLRGRLRVALTLREQLFSEPFYRLAYGDSDGLPGLIVDRYGEYVVVQIATAGMEVLLEALVAWPPEWGVPSRRALAFSRSHVPAFLVGALVAAVCAATLADGLASWTVLFGFGLAGAVFVVRVLPRPQIFFTAVYAAMFVLSFGAAWVRNPGATLRLYAVLFVLVVAFSLAWSLSAHRRGLGQRISVKKGDRPAYRFSLDGLNWGEAAHERVAWGALTSVEPVGLGDRSLGDVSGVCRVIVRGERE